MKKFLMVTAAVPAILATQPVHAQSQDSTVDDDSANAEARDEAKEASGEAILPEPIEGDVIVVTAQKRAENLQDVPISAVALGAQALENANVTNVTEIQRVAPGLTIARAQNTTNQNVRIRGIGSGSSTAIEPSVAFFLDGIYVPRAGSVIGNLVDVESVEVLRGPQGTLFGRNASVGAITINTALPRFDDSVSARLRVANYGQMRSELVLNKALGQTVAVRLAGSLDFYQGDFTSLNPFPHRLGETNTRFGRASVLWEPSANFSWVVRGDYQHVSGDGQTPYEVLPETLPANNTFPQRTDPDGPGPLTGPSLSTGDPYDRVVSNYLFGVVDDTIWGLSSDARLTFGNDYQLRLVSGYRDWESNPSEGDAIQTPVPLVRRNQFYRSKSHSHELQLISPERALFSERFDFVAGLYAYNEEYSIDTTIDLLDSYCRPFIANILPALLNACVNGPKLLAGADYFDQETTSLAGYFQGTAHLTDTFRLVGGIRYSDDEKNGGIVQINRNAAELFHGNETTALVLEESRFTYRAAVEYDVSPDIFVFGSYSTGFKSGGFNSSFSRTILGQSRLFNAETVANYDVGIRSQMFDRRVTTNVTLYRMDIDGVQERGFDGLQFTTRNVGSLRQQGVEFDLSARPVRDILVGVSGAYLDSEYTSYRNAPNLPGLPGTQDLTGTRANFSPKWQGNAYAQYDGDLGGGWTWMARGDLRFVSSQNLGSDSNNNPDTIEPAYQLLSARLGVTTPDDRVSLALFGENITDTGYCGQRVTQTAESLLGVRDSSRNSTVIRCVVGSPRRYGLEARFQF